jgi:hypothetical protein
MQLRRGSNLQQLMLERGVLRYEDSPLLRAVAHGRVLRAVEADKALEHVIAIFRILPGRENSRSL